MRLLAAVLLLAGEAGLAAGSPWKVLWSGPGVIGASVMIAWAAEAAQFFLAQGIALALLALLQTLPEFAVEAVLAWHREVSYLLANLTGALKLLTGLGWPLIYFAAATAHRRDRKAPLRRIRLEEEQAIQVLGLLAAIAWQLVVWWKGSLNLLDGLVLLAIYAGYMWIMRCLPPQSAESLEDIAAVPRAIVKASKPVRITAILGLFLVGGVAVFLLAEPFLAALLGLSAMIGVPTFVFIAWVAPLVSEAPEGVSAFYWARDHERASIALMNLVSSNINQWTLLAAMLPLVLSISAGHATPIRLDLQQSRELIMTLGQSLLGALFLLNMELLWWEAAALFTLWLIQFVFSIGDAGARIHVWITGTYFVWCAAELARLFRANKKANALHFFRTLKRLQLR